MAKWASCGFNAGGMAIFWMARCFGAPLAEVFDLLESHIRIAGEVQQRIEQHGAVACRQDKPVTIRPMRRRGVKFKMLFEQNSGHIGHAHGHAGVSRVGSSNGVQRQSANGRGFFPVFRVLGGESFEIHGYNLLFGLKLMLPIK